MKKALTVLVLTMFLLSLSAVFAAPENTGPQNGTGANHDAIISAGGQNGTGAQGSVDSQEGAGLNNDSGNANKEQVENKGTDSNIRTRNQNFFPDANMSLGQCKAGFAKEQKICTKDIKTINKECRINAKNQTDSKTAFQTCKSEYKKSMNQCKATFKLGKTECGNLTKKIAA